ncbi:sigma-70 family RNA polymerase sigma factor [Phytoactinopolyspora sp. XMNu-373]|uniref:Sigma-70 family RNA polymerase sigma factor n=2 Tax=Phytoactinopolyspora mesophila TaxID=2650750 RepID=A0A7K3M650_9ACTN|nr:sigma-70 family RNA polymerase sigma factor [Phytoactinopolyspora mesophila]
MLFGVAYRLLGSVSEADDVLQDAFLKWLNVERDRIREPRRYLTRIVTRLAIDRLQARAAQNTYVGSWLPEPVPTEAASWLDPLETSVQRDSVATATMHLMERLDPVERAVFVLRQAFELPYAEIAETVERTAEHCRQLHRRASQRIGQDRRRFRPSRREHARLLERFLEAARDGDLAALRTVLRDDVVVWSDSGGKARAARNAVHGLDRVSRFFAGIYSRNTFAITPIELNGSPGAVLQAEGTTHAITFAVADDVISGVFLVVNPDKLTAFQPAE